MKTPRPDDQVYNAEEREEILAQMRQISGVFYTLAIQAKNHAFIEFCGLMNEFLQVCERAHQMGQDFTQANTHTGQSLPFETFNAAYLAEKLNCIYGPALLDNPDARLAFIQTLFEGKYRLVPMGAPEVRVTESGPRTREEE